MNEEHLALERRIREDLETLERLWEQLSTADLPLEKAGEKERIAVAYWLHNVYNAVENVFVNIARSFGNRIDQHAGWHAELLERMRLDLTPLRPAVIDRAASDQLVELRRFRHLFRAAYGAELDGERMSLVYRKAMVLRDTFPRQIEIFLEFLRSLDS